VAASGATATMVHKQAMYIGVGNGDPNCHESDKEPRRSLFDGLTQVILQSSKTAGTIVIEATASRGDRPS